MRYKPIRKAGMGMDDLLRIVRTREIIEKYKFKFSKSLGQNFLIDDAILKKIIESSGLTKDDSVLEIGPGIGTLTMELASHAKKVLTIELDSSLMPILEDIFKGYDNIKIHHGDALKEDLKQVSSGYLDEPVSICANIPYYITTPLITKFFKGDLKIKTIVLMVQKEVAQRMVANPGGKDYGALSLLVQYYSKPSIEAIAPPKCFMPRPKVDSAVIKLDINKEPPVEIEDEDLFFRIIRSSFEQRRKTLSNSLKPLGIPSQTLLKAFQEADIDPKRRGETLSLQEFAALYHKIEKALCD
jgi:16S rRNA (adenine1518-N6/adenine1519-N6)-dimethyltransferase